MGEGLSFRGGKSEPLHTVWGGFVGLRGGYWKRAAWGGDRGSGGEGKNLYPKGGGGADFHPSPIYAPATYSFEPAQDRIRSNTHNHKCSTPIIMTDRVDVQGGVVVPQGAEQLPVEPAPERPMC